MSILIVIYGILCFGVRAFLHWQKTGKTGFVLGKTDNAHDYIGKVFGIILLVSSVYIFAVTFYKEPLDSIAPTFFYNYWLVNVGLILILLATVLCFVAQMNMRDSWRVGIDYANAGKLVTRGLFRYSRNPIFFTMLSVLLGVFLILPNWISLLILITSYLLIQIQVRLEEEFLKIKYSVEYTEYSKKTRRWL